MTATPKPAAQPDLKEISVHRYGKMDPILGRIDLIAILIASLGICLLGVAMVVLATIELVRLVASLWADSFDRWLILTLGVAIIWIIARWRRLCVF